MLIQNKVQLENSDIKEIERNLPKYCRQKPNNRVILVFNSRPYFYAMGSRGKDNKFKRFLRNSFGETPVIVDSLFCDATITSFKAYLKTMGFYYPQISYHIDVNKRQKAIVTYTVKLNKRYRIGSYDYQIADKELFEIVDSARNQTLIRVGRPMLQEQMLAEQNRIVNLLRNKGFLGISNEFVDFDLDTTSADDFVKLALNITNPSDTVRHVPYYVNDITIDIEKNIGFANNPSDTAVINGIRYNLGSYKLNPNVLERSMLMTKGQRYSQEVFSKTYSRLADLSIFKFINIQAKPQEITRDSGIVNYAVKLSPTIKYTFTFEPQAITSDANNTLSNQSFRNYGISGLFQLTNRNVFRSAEILQLSYRTSFEAQGQAQTKGLFNATEQSLTASIIMPRILFFPKYDRKLNLQSTRTIISTSAIYEINVDYERRVLTTGINYQFNKKLVTFFVSPIELSYIRSSIRNDSLALQSENDIFLQNLFGNNFIMNSRVGLVYSNKSITKGLSHVFLRWDALELAGNALSLLAIATNQPKGDDGSRTILGVKYFQYIKTALDFRYNTIFDQNNSTVLRMYVGAAIPYGNTPDFVPFERRFFIGGVNSLRAWRPRSIGPGSYTSESQIDYSGELKLELNAEYRFNIYNRWLEGAVFTDAGNIWIIKKDETRPGAEFRSNRYIRELAWDAGLGIRFNFTVFIVRFDFAIPLRDPTLSESSRWVINSFSEGDWILKNTNFNFGIGYPF